VAIARQNRSGCGASGPKRLVSIGKAMAHALLSCRCMKNRFGSLAAIIASASLLFACSSSQPQTQPTLQNTNQVAMATSAEARDLKALSAKFLESLQDTKKLEPMLASSVVLANVCGDTNCTDEGEPKSLRNMTAAEAAIELSNQIEKYIPGDYASCDGSCCLYTDNFQRGDMLSVIGKICFDESLAGPKINRVVSN
jgi:hypothetical protein